MTEQKQTYLLLFSFGPVQSFISKSRKLKDLFNASSILSDLAFEIILEAQKASFEILSPSKINQGVAVPNRFLAKIHLENSEDLEGLAEVLEQKLRAIFLEKGSTVLVKQFPQKAFSQSFLKNWEDQLSKHLEVYWIAIPASNNFEFDYQKLNRSLAALKNEKTFKQLAESGRKCRLEGDLNTLVYRKTDKNVVPKYIIGGHQTAKKDLNPGEGLSAIGFLKRFYSQAPYDSTAAFALSHLKTKISNKKVLKDFEECLPAGAKDDQLFYPENQNDRYAEKQGIKISKKQLSNLKSRYQNLKTEIRKEHLKIHNHYAVLVFDGDWAGKWLAGGFKAEIKDLAKYQEDVSGYLVDFADAVKKKVNEEWGGMTIYAGGDDFIGFLHLEGLLETLSNVNELFSEKVNIPIKNRYQTTQDFTISAGVALAHYSENLGSVIEFGKSLEAKSKAARDKNTITLGMVTRSAHGLTTDLSTSWSSLYDISNLFKFFRKRPANSPPGKTLPALISNNLLKSISARYRHFNLDENLATVEYPDTQSLIYPSLSHFIRQAYNGQISEKGEIVGHVNQLIDSLSNQGLGVNEITRMIQLLEVLSRLSTPHEFEL
jgi:CRISPR-associated protein Cmr2